jgi:hypothetical protein
MTKRGMIWRLLIVVALLSIFFSLMIRGRTAEAEAARPEPTPTPMAKPSPPKCDMTFPLPRPSGMKAKEFEHLLYSFLDKGCYKTWIADSQIRNTGPFIGGASFGTHPAVKIFYSPEAWNWLKTRGREGDIPDGTVIVKEMFDPPAEEGSELKGWTVMVKDSQGSHDGWYWSYHGVGQAPSTKPEIDYPDSGFGLYCIRCHASAEKESTFLALKNVEGDPISFVVSVLTTEPLRTLKKDLHEQVATASSTDPGFPKPNQAPDPHFLATFKNVPLVAAHDVKRFPGETLDHVVPGKGGPKSFLTSSQCLGCHSASNENMALLFQERSRKPINLSPYTEWRASMMGLAGRDPIFHAQLESEKALYPTQATFFDNTCYRCHGVMGQRQLELDTKQPFRHGMVYAKPDAPNGKYGSLARDGVSCAVCHQISKDGLGQPESFTGLFKLDPFNVVNGPYDDVITLPMKNALNITPQYGEQIKSSALCGSCHTVILPVLDGKGNPVLDKKGKAKNAHEQTTYVEWLNSIYQNERQPFNPETVKTCQDCHMPTTYEDRQLAFRIANIEDINYPYADHRARDKDITVKVRDRFSRHTLVGINLFGLMMFQQFPDILGIRTADYMYVEGEPGLLTSQNSVMQLAREETARVEVSTLNKTGDYLEAAVRVENLAGHSLPSGVAFRRAFLSFEVLDEKGHIVWASGRTNKVGAIVKGMTDDVLPTEFFYDPQTKKQIYQPHHNVINDESQVQIYEEIMIDVKGRITTSFVALDKSIKNNRLLPKGWKPDGPYADFSGPHGEALNDPEYIEPNYRNLKNYAGSKGSDTIIYRVPLNQKTQGAASVRVALYYQAIPPYYLKERFAIGKGPETERLGFITSRMKLDGTPIEDWKLQLVCQTRRLNEGRSSPCSP